MAAAAGPRSAKFRNAFISREKRVCASKRGFRHGEEWGGAPALPAGRHARRADCDTRCGPLLVRATSPPIMLGAHQQVRLRLIIALTIITMIGAYLESIKGVQEERRFWRDRRWIMNGRMWHQLQAFHDKDDDQWKSYVGVTKPTFTAICELVRDDMPAGRNNISSDYPRTACLEERVAVGLYQLHHGVARSVLRHVTKWGASTASGWTLQLAKALAGKKMEWIYLPYDDELGEISRGFEALPNSGLPGCVGELLVY